MGEAIDLVGKAPETTDPVTWIAMFLVFALMLVLFWQLRASAAERKETAERGERSQTAFLAELSREREYDRERTTVLHARIDSIKERLGELKRAG